MNRAAKNEEWGREKRWIDWKKKINNKSNDNNNLQNANLDKHEATELFQANIWIAQKN